MLLMLKRKKLVCFSFFSLYIENLCINQYHSELVFGMRGQGRTWERKREKVEY